MSERLANIERKTKETDIKCSLNIDGSGKCEINTGIGFLDHMLEGFARHGLFDLTLTCNGDLNVDCHHSAEDIGIVLGSAIKDAIGEKKGIKRYGSMILPMDDALMLVAVDLCGRPYFAYESDYSMPRIGDLDSEMIRDFFYAVSYSAMMNLHIKQLDGFNNHHIAEATFKAFAKALDDATRFDERITGVLSTKGTL